MPSRISCILRRASLRRSAAVHSVLVEVLGKTLNSALICSSLMLLPTTACATLASWAIAFASSGASLTLIQQMRLQIHPGCKAGSWTKPRCVIAKVEWHPGESRGRSFRKRQAVNTIGLFGFWLRRWLDYLANKLGQKFGQFHCIAQRQGN
jgi:hypothetical protein